MIIRTNTSVHLEGDFRVEAKQLYSDPKQTVTLNVFSDASTQWSELSMFFECLSDFSAFAEAVAELAMAVEDTGEGTEHVKVEGSPV